ncbi:molybdate ABC transporter substrate-binding protein [Chondromyces apiculatus]|uniref:Molybdenum ABC transporter, periplasmic molybdenum-binding protein ModA n=1 Tax=Chondromyces apiculatus DSM 436 TaxID=1192034 RepID=A0A017TEH6_9BACT|nr:molybdate ABC transporter substrate-binding protein [Chondromyces apiculatus]EYF06996.1 Molybdenum ABC transporter, periplasmic molybdenum-binding protein ModA [Chondromyces apiculatus DSM 436]
MKDAGRHAGARWPGVVMALVAAVLSVVGGGACKREEAKREVTLGVAASLRQAMPELVKAYEREHPGVTIKATYGASGSLQKQVEGGAPLDGVVFASAAPVDALIARGLSDGATRRVLATNTLVLIGPAGGKPVTLTTLGSLPPGERIALGEPETVPAGQYAKEALQKLGTWEGLRERLVYGGDVAAVLAYAKRGEVAAAFVYRSEVRSVEGVVVLDEVSRAVLPRVEVVAATVSRAQGAPEAGAFLEHCGSAAGQQTLAAFGFGPP